MERHRLKRRFLQHHPLQVHRTRHGRQPSHCQVKLFLGQRFRQCIMLCRLTEQWHIHLKPMCFIKPSAWESTWWMTMSSGTIGSSAHHLRWKQRSFFCTATSRPKIRQNAETRSALACKASCVPAKNTKSSAAAVS